MADDNELRQIVVENKPISRKSFLRLSGVLLVAVGLAACAPESVYDPPVTKETSTPVPLKDLQGRELALGILCEISAPDFTQGMDMKTVEKLTAGFWGEQPAGNFPGAAEEVNKGFKAYLQQVMLPKMVDSGFFPALDTARCFQNEKGADDGQLAFRWDTAQFSSYYSGSKEQTRIAYAATEIYQTASDGRWHTQIMVNSEAWQADQLKPGEQVPTHADVAAQLAHEFVGHFKLEGHLLRRFLEIKGPQANFNDMIEALKQLNGENESYGMWIQGATLAGFLKAEEMSGIKESQILPKLLPMNRQIVTAWRSVNSTEQPKDRFHNFPRWMWPEWRSVTNKFYAMHPNNRAVV